MRAKPCVASALFDSLNPMLHRTHSVAEVLAGQVRRRQSQDLAFFSGKFRTVHSETFSHISSGKAISDRLSQGGGERNR